MSIIQVAKIQHRSGNINELPQLDTAEFGLAVDIANNKHRLFIGPVVPIQTNTSPISNNIEIFTQYSTFNRLVNGTTDVSIFDPDGNVTFGVNGVPNVMMVSSNSVLINDDIILNRNVYANNQVISNVAGDRTTGIGSPPFTVASNITVANLYAEGAEATNVHLATTGIYYPTFVQPIPAPANLRTLYSNVNLYYDTTPGQNKLYTPNANISTDLIIGNSLTVGQDLYVAGNLTYINVENLQIEDTFVELGKDGNGIVPPDTYDRGVVMNFSAGTQRFMGWDSSATEFMMLSNTVWNPGNLIVNTAASTYGNLRLDTLNASNLGLSNNLFVSGYANITGNINGASNLNITANANITGNTNITANANVTGQIYGSSNLFITSNANITGNTNITANANITGNINGASNLNITANANITGNTNITANANVTGNINGSSNLNITANAIVGGNVYANVGNVIAGNINGSANLNITSNANITGNLHAMGNSILGSNANVFITGGANTHVLITDGLGNLRWGPVVSGNAITFSNVFANAPNVVYNGNTAGYVVSFNTVGAAQCANILANNFYALGVSNPANTIGMDPVGNGVVGNIYGNWVLAAGTSLQATYADLAEYYVADANYEPGTVLEFGGQYEVTVAEDETVRVAGVVSTNPAYGMNANCTGENVVALALQGRVPCKVRGNIKKGDMMTSGGGGYARPTHSPKIGTIIGKSLQDFSGEGVIEIAVGRL